MAGIVLKFLIPALINFAIEKSGESKVKTVLVCGSSGVGKTQFINIATGANLPVGYAHGLRDHRMVDQGIPPIKFGDTSVQLVDTPGFRITPNADEILIFREIVRWLVEQYRANRHVVGIIYLRSIQDPNVLGHEAHLMQAFKDLCGEDCLDRIVVVTSRWHPFTDEIEERRERDITTDVRKFGSTGSNRVQIRRLRNGYTTQDARELLKFFGGYSPVTLQVQREVVDNRASFSETTAGRRIEANGYRQIEGNNSNNAGHGADVAVAQLEEGVSPLWGVFAALTVVVMMGVIRRRRWF